ncbi:hybrid sensor histidine kinase/response regulator [Desulfospira joergensenii]|uniref:hybrid sensor histidine kinase/response regulator n=1 Tax=Desulfospira joergensenii TaxID=53329 RepID=UPI0003B3D624|nr:ATP-binding protein [Desulfospira joergensenii]
MDPKAVQLTQLFHMLGTDCKKNIDKITEQACSLLGTCFSFCLRVDNDSFKVSVLAGRNLPEGFEEGLKHCSSFFGKNDIEAVDPVYLIPDMTRARIIGADTLVENFGLRAWLAVPLPGTVTDLLCTADTQPREFSRDDIEILKSLAAALARETRQLEAGRAAPPDPGQRLDSGIKGPVGPAEKYRVLIENINDCIYLIQDGFIKFANPKTADLSGYPMEELLKIPFMDIVHPGDSRKVMEKHKQRLKGEDFGSTYSFRALNRQGKTIWVQVNSVRVIWEGQPAILGCLRDISRVKELEEKLNRAEKMELIGIMAGGVAHDLNNILSGLVSYPEVLLLQIDKNSPLREPIMFMHDAGKKAAEIVQDLLTLTRRRVVNENIINLNNVVHEYFNSPAHRQLELHYSGVTFSSDSEPELMNIKGSETHISKVIMNLVMNAAEAVEPGGQVSIQTCNRYVDMPISGYDEINEGEYAVLRVSDDGQGISKPDLEKIFEPFYTKKQMGRSGSGLGLSVVWNTVKDHEGYIEVRSRKNRGTIFELFFPATRNISNAVPQDMAIEDFRGNKEKILVVDDIKEQRRIAKGCLEMLGYTPFSAGSGEEALEFLKDNPVDLLILDMKMDPGIDGFETYKKTLEINPLQRAIIASGYSENPRIRKTLKLGAGQYIKKPFTIRNLAVAIKKELHCDKSPKKT